MIVRLGLAFLTCVALATAGDLRVQSGTSIQAAITSAQAGDRVLVDPGVYAETIDFLAKDIQVIGVGGAAFTSIDGSGFNASVVTIDGGVTAQARLEGFTICGGSGTPAAFPPGASNGGGIYVGYGAPIIEFCIIENNAAANGIGGGVFLSAETKLASSIVRSNVASYGGGVSGGQLEHVLVQSNQAAGDGGGVVWATSMRWCRIDANSANGVGGGAVLVAPGDLDAEYCSFTNNSAFRGGGVFVADSNSVARATLRRCRIEGNVAQQGGGGVWMAAYTDANPGSTGTVRLESCILRQNTSQDGVAGGAYLDVLGACPTCATVTARQCVFDANDIVNSSTAVFDGGIFVNHPSPLSGGTVNWSIAPVAYPGTGSFMADPLFVDDVGGDLHLTAQSPCIDMAPMPVAEADIEGDIRSTPSADVGADEFAPHVYVHGDPTPGATVALRIVGAPGDYVILFASTTLSPAPIETQFGSFALGMPLLFTDPVPLGMIPANGVLGFSVPLSMRLPTFTTLHTQCLLQGTATSTFTNVETVVLM